MSTYLGFKPTEDPNYYFVSYNSEDVSRVGSIAETVSRSGISLWYDYGIEYGETWETTIAERIQNTQQSCQRGFFGGRFPSMRSRIGRTPADTAHA